ncbi:hypothetical protein HY605_00970 [Candidatus Peregrinibacteria bacterium]|nr:hypothetical protein [Candidatus Peregrinibacteria bacterium]
MPPDDFEGKRSENVERGAPLDKDEHQLEQELEPLRDQIRGLLQQPDPEGHATEDTQLREDALVDVILAVAEENDLNLFGIMELVAPEKADFFSSPLGEADSNEEPFFLHLKVMYAAVNYPNDAIENVELFKDRPYAEETIKSLAASNPFHTLDYSDGFKDQPYAAKIIEDTVKVLAKKSRYGELLQCASKFKDQPYGPEVIEKAVRWLSERQPKDAEDDLLVRYSDQYRDQPYAAGVLEKAVKRLAGSSYSGPVLRFRDSYKDQPYAAEVLEKAVKSLAKSDPFDALSYWEIYKDQPYGAEVMKDAIRLLVRNNPSDAFGNALLYHKDPWAADMIKEVAQSRPAAILYSFELYKNEPWAADVVRAAIKSLLKSGKKKDKEDAEYYEKKYKDLLNASEK